MNVVIAGGGTAGHVNPALALAEALDADARITFVGTSTGVESKLVPAAGYDLDEIVVVGFDRARPLQLPAVAVLAARAVAAARRVLTRRAPDVVVGVGGYVSLPVCLAARAMRIPVVLHEQNIVLGLANRIVRPLAAAVAVSFAESLPAAGRRGVLVGNPVRREIAAMDRASARAAGYERFGLDPGRTTIIVFGGSLGARTLNAAAPALAERWRDRNDLQLLHISGRAADAGVGPGSGDGYRRVEYTDAMAEAYAAADLAVCRGGATTIAELTVVGLPSVIVPYPHHRDRQQERHGKVLERAGAAVVVDDEEATAERLGMVVERILDEQRIDTMAEAARRLGRPDAAARLARVVKEATWTSS
ncbi:MAG TPA: undecaprenyldiphospho-muramoylpentapeptide beta-N-acetylglucosaminyltransferase [Actinomycetota bacterium]|nr:undecaprenyldiphospho-muramoylpentapeptide beta-N-acetylglucosaminyltransferase [Actinomycetota bacterium]